MIVIGLAGYLLPIPSLIWAWVRWLKSAPRFGSPKWRTVLAFCDLILVSTVGLFVFAVALYANHLPEGNAKYAFAVASSRLGFLDVCNSPDSFSGRKRSSLRSGGSGFGWPRRAVGDWHRDLLT